LKTLLVIAHDPSPNLRALKQALLEGAGSPEIEDVNVQCLNPFDTEADAVQAADAVLLLTPENLGYMSGALKDFFDRCFHDLDGRTDAMPYALLVRAGMDGTGTRRAVESICGGLKWKAVQPPLICRGEGDADFIRQAKELGQTLAASLEVGLI
jgi:NAD(P)H-dependent FMN reductase